MIPHWMLMVHITKNPLNSSKTPIYGKNAHFVQKMDFLWKSQKTKKEIAKPKKIGKSSIPKTEMVYISITQSASDGSIEMIERFVKEINWIAQLRVLGDWSRPAYGGDRPIAKLPSTPQLQKYIRFNISELV